MVHSTDASLYHSDAPQPYVCPDSYLQENELSDPSLSIEMARGEGQPLAESTQHGPFGATITPPPGAVEGKVGSKTITDEATSDVSAAPAAHVALSSVAESQTLKAAETDAKVEQLRQELARVDEQLRVAGVERCFFMIPPLLALPADHA
jgi:hypothetical protein